MMKKTPAWIAILFVLFLSGCSLSGSRENALFTYAKIESRKSEHYDLARLLVDMIQTDKYGRYHATNEGLCSWYEFAKEIFRQAGMDVPVTPVSSDAFPAKATRPSNSRLNKDKLSENGFERLPAWQDALGRFLKEIEY